MNLPILALLLQDGITTGAVYALLALAIVLVFTVTRVIWVPAGEFVAFGTLTLAGLQLGRPPGTIGLLTALALVAGVLEWAVLRAAWRHRRFTAAGGAVVRAFRWRWPGPRAWLAGPGLPYWAQILLTLALVTRSGTAALSDRVPAHRRGVGAGAAGRLGRRALRADGHRALPLRRRRRADAGVLAAPFTLGGVSVGMQSLLVVGASLRADRRAGGLLRAHALRQGVARNGDQPRRARGWSACRRASPAR